MNPLARIAYNMIAEGGEAVGKSAADDVLKAASKIADEGVEVVDDWGWKGGKPGEVTAGQLKELRAKPHRREEADYILRDHVERFYEKYPDSPLASQMQRNGTRWIGNTAFDVKLFEDVMSTLEKADVPREWTGLLASILPQNVIAGPTGKRRVDTKGIKRIADTVRSLRADERETFAALLPEWTESLDDLVAAVRTL